MYQIDVELTKNYQIEVKRIHDIQDQSLAAFDEAFSGEYFREGSRGESVDEDP